MPNYIQIFTDAQSHYNKADQRPGFGKPKKPRLLSVADLLLLEKLNALKLKQDATEKHYRKIIVAYLNAQINDGLQQPFSLASYLLDELIKTDVIHQNKWKYYIPKPIVKYDGSTLLYHGTKIPPSVIFEQGLTARFLGKDYQTDRERYAQETTKTYGVSTTTKKEVAISYALPCPILNRNNFSIDFSTYGYVYKIRYKGQLAIDIDGTLRYRGKTSLGGKHEVNIAEQISPEQIIGAWRYSPTNTYKATWIPNPKAPNTEKQTVTPVQSPETKKQGDLPTKEQTAKQEAISKIKTMIEKNSTNRKWQFGPGGSWYKICINDKEYQVPHGIKKIWDILNDKSLPLDSKLESIKDIAARRITQHHTFLFWGQRKPQTRYHYDKICDLADGHTEKGYTAAKTSMVC